MIYHSRLNPSTRRNFEVFTATDFLAAITQHIPEKGAQTVKYYGFYSNKARGQRAKTRKAGLPVACCAPVSDRAPVATAGLPDQPGDFAAEGTAPPEPGTEPTNLFGRRRVPSRAWRELIKQAWDVDPLLCPKCGGPMRLLALIEQDPVIERILRHLDLWEEPAQPTARGPPQTASATDREAFTDDLPFGPDTYAE